MKILAIEKELREFSSDENSLLLKGEAKRVWDYYIDGYIREIYFTPEHLAVLILECKDEKEARSIISSLPLVQKGLIDFDIKTLLPYDGFERLFEK